MDTLGEKVHFSSKEKEQVLNSLAFIGAAAVFAGLTVFVFFN